jgi:hypothetical protein
MCVGKWTIEKARQMVSHTKGYYARDYSLNLGWNNVSAEKTSLI